MEPVLSCESIVKDYGSTRAVDQLSISLKKGEILALLGENGAGKSTLVKILSGVVKPDAGEIRMDGSAVAFSSARAAAQAGIHLVHQELALLPERTVTENIFLGQELRNHLGMLDWRAMQKHARAAMKELGVEVSVNTRVREFSTSVQQMVEIARASVGESRVVILDEPTAALSPADADRLFGVVNKMRARGVSFIYISHRLDEVKELADTVVVMKDGKFVTSKPCSQLTIDEMVSAMVGRDLEEFFPEPLQDRQRGDEPVISIKNLVDPPAIKEASLEIFPGEIVGIYGLEGHGQDEILACIAGARKPLQGEMMLRGKPRKWGNSSQSIQAGLGYVPEDRKTEGLILDFSSVQNASLPILRSRLTKAGFVERRREAQVGDAAMQSAGVRGDVSRPVGSLSGGNQQKVVLARWLAADSDVLLLNQPTRGVDVGAKAEIYTLVRRRCEKDGVVALVVSREISELLGFCDRILVMSYGKLVAEHSRDASEEEILASAVGGVN